METILVTGGAGFIGSHVAEELVRMGQAVLVLDDLSGGFRANVPEGARFIEGSILDGDLLDKIFCENKVKLIYHLAAYAAEGLSHFIRRFNYTNNVVGSVNLINKAVLHDVECFVFSSSIAVYGKNQLPFSEETVPHPEDPYGIAKYAVEMDLRSARDMFGLNYIIFRPHNVYGERQNIGDKYRNVVGIFMNSVLQKMPMPVFGDGTQTRAFSYIADVAVPIARSGFVPSVFNNAFNIGADKPYTINEVAAEVAKAFGVPPEIQHLQARNEVQHAYSSHEKARKAFGAYMRDIPLADGISRMADWARRVGSKRSASFLGIEVEKNLPPVWLK
jgi:UDP-glucose 4-epimerase